MRVQIEKVVVVPSRDRIAQRDCVFVHYPYRTCALKAVEFGERITPSLSTESVYMYVLQSIAESVNVVVCLSVGFLGVVARLTTRREHWQGETSQRLSRWLRLWLSLSLCREIAV